MNHQEGEAARLQREIDLMEEQIESLRTAPDTAEDLDSMLVARVRIEVDRWLRDHGL